MAESSCTDKTSLFVSNKAIAENFSFRAQRRPQIWRLYIKRADACEERASSSVPRIDRTSRFYDQVWPSILLSIVHLVQKSTMAQIHLRKARKHLQLVHKPDGSIDWATAPLLPQVNRSNKFRELWPKTNPDLGSMPTEILENIARNLMAHTTRLVPVSKRDADDARNAASVRAQYDAANQEVTRLLHKDRLTRSEAKRRAELHRFTCDMSAKVDRSDSLRRLGYQFFDSPLFKINKTIRSAARTALIEVNEFSLRPEVLFSNEDWWSKEGSVPNMRFDELSEQILINSPRIEVIVHW